MDRTELFSLLQELYLARDHELRQEFDRSLAFDDAMFDRWQRAERLGFGERASIYASATVFGDVRVGASTWIGPNTLLDGSGGRLEIGTHCSVSAGVQIYTHDTVEWALSGGTAGPRRGPVSVGDRCYIGSQCIIALDSEIGTESVVAANSFVNGAFPSRAVLAGTPASVIGSVEFTDDGPTLQYRGSK